MKDITGQKFGKLIVIKRSGINKWLCGCDCGNEKVVDRNSLITGGTRSCGYSYVRNSKTIVCRP